MNKAELIESVAGKTGSNAAEAGRFVQAMTDVVSEALMKEDKVTLPGFGTFETSHRSARKGRNPSTGQEIDIAASVTAKFKPGKALKDSLNEKLSS